MMKKCVNPWVGAVAGWQMDEEGEEDDDDDDDDRFLDLGKVGLSRPTPIPSRFLVG